MTVADGAEAPDARPLPADVTNWGRWGDTSEAGALNLIGPAQVVAAARLVTRGVVFALGLRIFAPEGDPLIAVRPRAMRVTYRDWSHFQVGHAAPLAGGVAHVDDGVFVSTHGTTHVDALGHIIAGGRMWDDRDAALSVGGMQWASIDPIAAHGVLTRGVLVDVARARGVDALPATEQITFAELQEVLTKQGVDVGRGDVVLLRTGSLRRFYEVGAEAFFRVYSEPGLTYEEELVAWCRDTEISGLGSDTLANELPRSSTIPAEYPLHRYVMRNLGVLFHEALWLEDLAADCAADGRYDGLYTASPLRMIGVSASPVNPLFAK